MATRAEELDEANDAMHISSYMCVCEDNTGGLTAFHYGVQFHTLLCKGKRREGSFYFLINLLNCKYRGMLHAFWI